MIIFRYEAQGSDWLNLSPDQSQQQYRDQIPKFDEKFHRYNIKKTDYIPTDFFLLCCLGMCKIPLWFNRYERKYEWTNLNRNRNLIKISLVARAPGLYSKSDRNGHTSSLDWHVHVGYALSVLLFSVRDERCQGTLWNTFYDESDCRYLCL